MAGRLGEERRVGESDAEEQKPVLRDAQRVQLRVLAYLFTYIGSMSSCDVNCTSCPIASLSCSMSALAPDRCMEGAWKCMEGVLAGGVLVVQAHVDVVRKAAFPGPSLIRP